MKLIPLSKEGKNRNKFFAIVDDEDFDQLNLFNWFAYKSKNDNTYYARRNDEQKNTIALHRQIMNCTKGDGKMIDHQDGNGLNCQKGNMRFATNSQNQRNKRNSAGSLSKYIGVDFKGAKAWRARISVNKKSIHLGYFNEEIDAARTRDVAAKKYFGEFARLNFA